VVVVILPSLDRVSDLAHGASSALELVAIVIILGALAIAIVRGAKWTLKNDPKRAYAAFKQSFGRGLLLGLEVLVAADLLWTVAVDPTWENLAGLAFLVLIRTFLSWSLEVELEGHWPWQRKKLEAEAAKECADGDA
jgi:uncharacterized membrane protein